MESSVQNLAFRSFRRVWKPVQRRVVPKLAPNGYSLGPTWIQIQLLYKCNLRCSFCPQWGDTGSYKELPAAELRQMLPLSVLQRVVDEMPVSCEGFFLWGGETLQYPDIVPLVRHISRGRNCTIVTNGTYLARYAHDLVEAGLDWIMVSLDAGPDTHDRLRGAPGTFQAAMEGIRRVRAERSSQGVSRPTIVASSVLLPETIDELPGLIRLLRDAGVDLVFMNKQTYTTEQQGKAHDQVFDQLFQITPASWRGFVRSPEPDGAAKIRAVVEELRADPANQNFIRWDSPSWGSADYFNYYLNPAFAAPQRRACRFPWDAVCIYPNGDLSPCPEFPDFVVGNLYKASFPEIWNGPLFRQFREKLKERGRFPICTSCCHYYDD